MRIDFFDDGFLVFPENNQYVEKISCLYHVGCTVQYYNGDTKEVSVECSAYQGSFGYLVSEDGKLLFACSWYDGLAAYNIETNRLVWRFKRSRIGYMFIYPTYIIAQRYAKAILKFDVHSGELLGELRSGTIGSSWELTFPYILVEMIRGKLSVVNTETMTVVKVYKENTTNPNHCLSLLIQGCQLKDNALWIYGIEEHANYDDTAEDATPYARVIDNDFLTGL